MNRKFFLIAMAAGSGVRMGASLPKQFIELGGKPILHRTLEKFISAIPDVRIVTVLPKDYIPMWKQYCLENNFTYPQTVVAGGITRFHSVKNALAKVPDGVLVAIHDGVRPLVSVEMIRNMVNDFNNSEEIKALIPVVPTTDTLRFLEKENEELKYVSGMKIDRTKVFGVQTPQLFLSDEIKKAYDNQAFMQSLTDDASVAEEHGIPLSFCIGEKYNIKITTPEDLKIARFLMKK